MFKIINAYKKLQELLSGYKTYIVAIGGTILGVLRYFGVDIPAWIIGKDTGILLFLGLGGIRAGMKKIDGVLSEWLKPDEE